MSVKLSVRLTDETAAVVRRMADRSGSTQSEVLRQAIEEYAAGKQDAGSSDEVNALLRGQVADLRAQNERLTELLDHAQQTAALAVRQVGMLPEPKKSKKRK